MSKRGFFANIEEMTQKNMNYRQVVYTGRFSQLVLMSLLGGEEVGSEVHDSHDQFFRFEAGKGLVSIDSEEYTVKDGDCVIVPAGARHNVKNTGKTRLKFYSIYSPPQHRHGLVRKTKLAADENEEEFDGITTE